MKGLLTIFLTIVALSLATAICSADQSVIGSVKSAQGTAEIIRGSETIKAAPGLRLKQGDILRTGDSSSLGVVLRDDSLVSLGADSRLELDEFTFAPAQDKMSFVSRLSSGAAVFVSGTIGKLAPERVKVNTPSASIGIRGTKFAVKVSR